MMEWLEQYWWLLGGVLGSLALIAYRVSRRDRAEPFFKRLAYAIVPLLDPESEERKRYPPWVWIVFAVAALIFAALAFLDI